MNIYTKNLLYYCFTSLNTNLKGSNLCFKRTRERIFRTQHDFNLKFMKKIILIAVSAFLSMSAVFAQNCQIIDIPDPMFMDVNNDGIDGDMLNAVFVSENDGNDLNSGTSTSPVATIAKGIQIAEAEGKNVYVATGTYNLVSTLVLASGVSVFGQYSGLPDWDRSAAFTTIISGPKTAIIAQNINVETRIEGFEIHSADALVSGESSVGVRIINCSENVIVRFNTIISGKGANGANGLQGAPGNPGSPGVSGGNGSCDGPDSGPGGDSGNSVCAAQGGSGGDGGVAGDNNGDAGNDSPGGAFGGAGGAFGEFATDGQPGQDGVAGSNGINGTTNPQSVTLSASGDFLTVNGNNGTAGSNGTGGGGGGGGGAQFCATCVNGSGNGGGGGGAGGCGALGGNGGIGGGGSFAIVIKNSNSIIDRNILDTDNGGNGGNGGAGSPGGNGGSGGPGAAFCTDEIGAGGAGGNGGKGGDGWAGAGGNGGPSIAVVIQGTLDVQIGDNQFVIANGGSSGLGASNPNGGMSSPTGLAGLFDEITGTYSPLSIINPTICITDAEVVEPTGNPVMMDFYVALSSPAMQTINVDYSTEQATALDNIDFVPVSGTLTFLQDETVKNIQVEVLSDHVPSVDKYFYLNLSNPVNATISFSTGTGNILDNGMTEISSLDYLGNVQIFPNPVTSLLNISSDVTQYEIKVYDVFGKQLFEGNNVKTIDVSGFASGVYYINMKAEETTSNLRFVKSE